MKTQNLQYVAADLSHIENTMVIKHINDFCQLIEKHHVKEVFVNFIISKAIVNSFFIL